jgi:glycosyltransferase involved in cell wall biosynthesis
LACKSVVIPNGVDVSKFRPDLALGLAVRRELGIPPDSPVLGIVGDLIPLKGQEVFLKAASVVAEDWPAAHFLVVGSPRADASSQRYSQGLCALSESLGLDPRVIFTGRRSDIPAVLNALDALVVASATETGPLVLLEALACGVPVVSTPVGRAPELLRDGLVGYLYELGNHEALAGRLRSILADRRHADDMKRAARRTAEHRLGLQQSLLKIEEQVQLALQS